MWDPQQYAKFAAARARPFADLLTPVALNTPAEIVDLGCGSGELTATLARRWPSARVRGVDSSAQMLAAAQAGPGAGRVELIRADLRSWQPDSAVDLVVSNAALQWVPGHQQLLARFADWLAPGGVLAIQLPGNADAPSHRILHELRQSPRWRDRVGEESSHLATVGSPQDYQQLLSAAGLDTLAWETTYSQLLTGPDPVLAWLLGTALRPVLAALDDADVDAFLAELGPHLRQAYPAGPAGTVLPYRRVFAVGRRRGGTSAPRVAGLDHVQLAMAPGGEARARQFYAGQLGLTETPKPQPLRAAGGVWFAGPDGLALHLGVEAEHRVSAKAHVALRVADLETLAGELAAAGYPIRWDTRLPGPARLYTQDPFGNRLELVPG